MCDSRCRMRRERRRCITSLGMGTAFAVVALWSMPSAVEASDGAAGQEFQSLFNGEDLSGWFPVGNPAAFAATDGCIVSNRKGPYPVWLRSAGQYENFVLRFEYKTVGWYEGGFLIHAPGMGPASRMGMKLHIRHDRHPSGKRSPGAIYDVAEPLELANKPSGEWNRCEILCDWPSLRVTLNGALIHDIDVDRDNELKYRLRRGHIGIQGIGCEAWYRNIEIRELPDKEEWESVLPNRIDGLTLYEDTDWTLENGVLTGKGDLGFAITKKVYEGPFELQAWVKTIPNGNGGFFYRWNGKNRGPEVQIFNVPDSTNPTGSLYGIAQAERVVSRDEEWFLLQVFSDGPRTMVRVNGELASQSETLEPPHSGRVAFQQHTPDAVIQFRDVRIKHVDF